MSTITNAASRIPRTPQRHGPDAIRPLATPTLSTVTQPAPALDPVPTDRFERRPGRQRVGPRRADRIHLRRRQQRPRPGLDQTAIEQPRTPRSSPRPVDGTRGKITTTTPKTAGVRPGPPPTSAKTARTARRGPNGEPRWSRDASRPILEKDAPWTSEKHGRTPERYKTALRYLNVEDPKNARYKRQQKSKGDSRNATFCNVYVRDVCRLMDVPIKQRSNANTMVRWLKSSKGTQAGWKQVSPAEAQRLANLGKPVIVGRINTKRSAKTGKELPGHVAMLRPLQPGQKVPRVAQAGSTNHLSSPLRKHFRNPRTTLYFVHP